MSCKAKKLNDSRLVFAILIVVASATLLPVTSSAATDDDAPDSLTGSSAIREETKVDPDDKELGSRFDQRFLENLSSDPQKRRTSFRADLGKRSQTLSEAEEEVKRASRMKSFRSDLGKRRLDKYTRTSPKTDLLHFDGEERGTKDCAQPHNTQSNRPRRYAELTPGDEDEKTLVDLERMTSDKRARSFFRSDLGRRSADSMNSFAAEVPKRAGFRFRGDLGKRSNRIYGHLEKLEEEDKRSAFRGDLGRKRSSSLREYFSSDNTDDENLQRLIQRSRGYLDNDHYGAGDLENLDKRRFRADLG